MTREKMEAALVTIEARIEAADKHGLKATARWWREYQAILLARLAADKQRYTTG